MLTDSGGTDRTATTDGSGTFSFTGLPAGSYTLTETQPTAFLDGRDTPGTAGGTRSGTDALTGVTVGRGTTETGYLFAEVRGTALSGSVRLDTGAPLAGVQVTLAGTDDLQQRATVTVTTSSTGTYAFTGLRPGTYTVTEQQPAAYGTGTATAGDGGGRDGTNAVTDVVLSPGETATGYVFTDTTGSVAGRVFEDRDANGADDAEPALAGVTVVLLRDGTEVARTTTGTDGRYRFAGLPAGTYAVRGPRPTGCSTAPTSPARSTASPAVPRTASTRSPASSCPAAARRSTTRSASSGRRRCPAPWPCSRADRWPASSWSCAAGRPSVATATTGADGRYSFSGVRPGTYDVVQRQPAGYADGTALPGTGAGGTGGTNATTGVRLLSGTTATGYDFLEAGGSLSGLVYEDANGDGVAQDGEPRWRTSS